MSVFSVVDAASASLFGTLSHLRGKRIFHPRGTAFSGTLTVTAAAPTCRLFASKEPLPIIARLSRGIGFPVPIPDVLGVALRIPNFYGEQQHQDLLFCSSGISALGRRLFIPASDYYDRSYCTVLSYQIENQTWLLALFPHKPLFRLAIARPTGPWQIVGEIALGTALSSAETERLQFNPWNTGPDIEPLGFLQRLRKNSYRASQQARLQRR